jgi:hypothetical protein
VTHYRERLNAGVFAPKKPPVDEAAKAVAAQAPPKPPDKQAKVKR